MNLSSENKPYNLEDRCLLFSKSVRDFIKKLPPSTTNYVYSKQLARSSSSIGANYIEACERLGKKDFLLHAKIAKKEARESKYWLELVEPDSRHDAARKDLISESKELISILGRIIEKVQ